jgi:hypothetical protein
MSAEQVKTHSGKSIRDNKCKTDRLEENGHDDEQALPA